MQGASKDFGEPQEAKEETLKWPKEDLEETIKGFRGQDGRTDGQVKMNLCFLQDIVGLGPLPMRRITVKY